MMFRRNLFKAILLPAVLLAAGSACSEKPVDSGQSASERAAAKRWNRTLVESRALCDGVLYEHYSMDKIGGNVYILTADLSKGVLVDACWADGLCPNPATSSTNNGKQLRETLSETLSRRLGEGVVGGINGDYYHTRGGFTLSPHVEEGEPVFIGNPYELEREPAFVNGFTQYEDGTISFGSRSVSVKVAWNGSVTPVYSVNDTILALNPKTKDVAKRYQSANIYTSRLKEKPFPGVQNKVSTAARFLVCEASAPLKVNAGPIASTVKEVLDHPSAPPFVSGPREWVLQLTGETALSYAGAKAGDPLTVEFSMAIGAEAVKPVRTHIGGKYLVLDNGARGAGMDDKQTGKRVSIIGADKEGRKVMLIASQALLTIPDCSDFAAALGLWNAIRLDGGGSTEMAVAGASGVEIVCESSDSAGPERSNMNYIHLRSKQQL